MADCQNGSREWQGLPKWQAVRKNGRCELVCHISILVQDSVPYCLQIRHSNLSPRTLPSERKRVKVVSIAPLPMYAIGDICIPRYPARSVSHYSHKVSNHSLIVFERVRVDMRAVADSIGTAVVKATSAHKRTRC
jgi:hypothetical protein